MIASFKIKKIKKQSLGQILKAARSKLKISLEQAEQQTNIRAKYLKALENEDYQNLPYEVYSLGYLRRYAQFLNISQECVMGRFKQESCILKKIKSDDKLILQNKVRSSSFFITPKILLISLGVILVFSLFGYIFFQVKGFTSPPMLEITQPALETVVDKGEILIAGKTDQAATLTINNQPVVMDSLGNFQQTVTLSPGLNTFEIKAASRISKESKKTLKILANL